MTDQTKLILAIDHLDALTELLQGNEYQSFIYSQLTPVFYELKRQLTNSQSSAKITES